MKRKIKKDSIIKSDSLKNVYTNLGVKNKDKILESKFNPIYRAREELGNIYQASDIFSRAVDIVPQEMTREGFTVKAENQDYTKEVEQFF